MDNEDENKVERIRKKGRDDFLADESVRQIKAGVPEPLAAASATVSSFLDDVGLYPFKPEDLDKVSLEDVGERALTTVPLGRIGSAIRSVASRMPARKPDVNWGKPKDEKGRLLEEVAPAGKPMPVKAKDLAVTASRDKDGVNVLDYGNKIPNRPGTIDAPSKNIGGFEFPTWEGSVANKKDKGLLESLISTKKDK